MSKPDAQSGMDLSKAMHLCVDMQRLFADNSDWAIPWLPRILPNVLSVVRSIPERTIFTRFIPPPSPCEASGNWQRFYLRWRQLTLDRLPADMLEIVTPLRSAAPQAAVIDKRTYSPWHFTDLHERLLKCGCESVIVTGGETDMCVLATVLGAVDLSFHAIVVTDALCSSVDETHDAVIKLYHERFAQQITAISTAELLHALRKTNENVAR